MTAARFHSFMDVPRWAIASSHRPSGEKSSCVTTLSVPPEAGSSNTQSGGIVHTPADAAASLPWAVDGLGSWPMSHKKHLPLTVLDASTRPSGENCSANARVCWDANHENDPIR